MYGITLPPAMPKKIDLSKYVSRDGTNFNAIVLTLFASGGGSTRFADDTDFWDDVNTNRPLKFGIDATAVLSGIAIECLANSATISEGVPLAVECAFLVKPNTSWYRTTIVFGYNGDDTTITVVVDPITVLTT